MLNRTHLLASIALLALPTTAFAQEAPQTDDAAAANDEIIVTGTAGGGINRQAAAFAITNITSDAIDKAAPNSTADLFKVIPGVSAESSGGQNGANIFVRGYPSGGDAEFVTLTTQGVPFFSPPTLSFLENTQLIRVDETIARGLRRRARARDTGCDGGPHAILVRLAHPGSDLLASVVSGLAARLPHDLRRVVEEFLLVLPEVLGLTLQTVEFLLALA